jgi:formylglycine-generating enzyme required for sulfatase activity
MNLALMALLSFSTLAQTPTPNPADLNGDGVVDFQDLAIFQAQWGKNRQQAPATATPTHTPIPTDTPVLTNTPVPTNTPGELPPQITIDLAGLPAGAKPLEMVLIPAGSFLMGSSDEWSGLMEQPVHEVTIGYSFYIGRYEITQAQWLAVMGNWPNTEPNGVNGLGDDYPAYYISWGNGQAFIDALNQLGKGTFRYPSEAEWEYACRGSASNPHRYNRFYFGDSDCAPDQCTGCSLDTFAWWCGNNLFPNYYGTKPVGGKSPNDYGLYDMHGNVWEWCQDYAHSDYVGAPTDGSAWDYPFIDARMNRGGSWQLDANFVRSAYRRNDPPLTKAAWIGFRIVREAI